MPTDDKLKVLAVHAACLLLMIACVVLKVYALKSYPELGTLLVGGATFLWGKMGFKPSNPVLASIIAQLSPDHLDQLLSQRPPPPSKASSPPAPPAKTEPPPPPQSGGGGPSA
jgi:hypothetical protein